MKEIVKFKPVWLSKIFSITLSIGLVFSILCFLLIKLDYQIIFFMCSVVVFLLILFSFYLNRYDLDSIVIEENIVTFYFINKLLYEKQPLKYNLSEIQIKEDKRKIMLNFIRNSTLIAVVRKGAIENKKMEILEKVFAC